MNGIFIWIGIPKPCLRLNMLVNSWLIFNNICPTSVNICQSTVLRTIPTIRYCLRYSRYLLYGIVYQLSKLSSLCRTIRRVERVSMQEKVDDSASYMNSQQGVANSEDIEIYVYYLSYLYAHQQGIFYQALASIRIAAGHPKAIVKKASMSRGPRRDRQQGQYN